MENEIQEKIFVYGKPNHLPDFYSLILRKNEIWTVIAIVDFLIALFLCPHYSPVQSYFRPSEFQSSQVDVLFLHEWRLYPLLFPLTLP